MVELKTSRSAGFWVWARVVGILSLTAMLACVVLDQTYLYLGHRLAVSCGGSNSGEWLWQLFFALPWALPISGEILALRARQSMAIAVVSTIALAWGLFYFLLSLEDWRSSYPQLACDLNDVWGDYGGLQVIVAPIVVWPASILLALLFIWAAQRKTPARVTAPPR